MIGLKILNKIDDIDHIFDNVDNNIDDKRH
jgi:hypothetical protein